MSSRISVAVLAPFEQIPWRAALALALVLPTLLVFNLSPSPTFFNQAAAIGLWGFAVLAVAAAAPAMAPLRSVATLLAAGIACIAGALLAWATGALPAGLALSAAGTVGAALICACSGAAFGAGDGRDAALFNGFCVPFVVAGVLSTAIALLQVFAPDALDGDWIARSGLAGRAVGNLRQPNHLSSMMLGAAVALVPLAAVRSSRLVWATPLFALFVFVILLSGSRTGGVGVGVLALWGMLDRRLSRGVRALLIAAPLFYGAGWLFMSTWAQNGHHTFGAAARLSEGEISGSRFGIWSNTLALIRENPWAGVGWGEFNFAWSLSPFPGRPTAFFDHTHNLPLQLVVELGLPLGGAVLVLLAFALFQAFRRVSAGDGARGVAGRSAFVMVLLMALHSQLEYPLWYAYFLLPAAWAWGYSLAQPPVPDRLARRLWQRPVLAAGGGAMIITSLWSVSQYMTIARIFEPGSTTTSLEQRIIRGQRSILFAHHADYAAATTAETPSDAWNAFKRAPHYLLDTRLMMAWAHALAENGDLDRARHIAQRLREFRNPASEEFFAPCQRLVAATPLPFQCSPPSRAVDWREFRELH